LKKVYEAVSKKFGKIDILLPTRRRQVSSGTAVTEAHYDEQFEHQLQGRVFPTSKGADLT